MTPDDLVAFARKTAYLLTREVFETTELLAKTRDGTYDLVPPLVTTQLAQTVGDALRFTLPTRHGCKTGHQILKRKLFKKLVRARIFGPQRSKLLKQIEPMLEHLFSTPTDQLLFTAPYRGEAGDKKIIRQFDQLITGALESDQGVIILLADVESQDIIVKTRIKSRHQCEHLYFDYLFPLMVLLAQKESLILDINDLQYRICDDRGIIDSIVYHDLNELAFTEIDIPITVNLDDYITRRLLSMPSNPREAIEQAAITCTQRIIKQYGYLREVHFTERMYNESDLIRSLLDDPIPDGENRIIQLRAKILRDFPGSDDFVNAVERLTLAEFASMFIGLNEWRDNRGRII